MDASKPLTMRELKGLLVSRGTWRQFVKLRDEYKLVGKSVKEAVKEALAVVEPGLGGVEVETRGDFVRRGKVDGGGSGRVVSGPGSFRGRPLGEPLVGGGGGLVVDGKEVGGEGLEGVDTSVVKGFSGSPYKGLEWIANRLGGDGGGSAPFSWCLGLLRDCERLPAVKQAFWSAWFGLIAKRCGGMDGGNREDDGEALAMLDRVERASRESEGSDLS